MFCNQIWGCGQLHLCVGCGRMAVLPQNRLKIEKNCISIAQENQQQKKLNHFVNVWS